jgi:hypothetical protein
MATPYVISSDLVSAYPAKSLEIAQYIDGFKADLALVQNAQTGTTYSFVAADFTKLVTLSNASPVAVELPLEATVPWSAGTTLRLLNQGAGLVTVAGAVGVTINGTPLTLAQYKGANLIKTGTDTWTFIPFASGVGAAVYSDANTGTYTGYAYKTFTASGTLTVTTAGFADVLVVGGGGGGGRGYFGSGGGGGGGGLLAATVYLEVGTLTVTVGAAGAVGTTGSNVAPTAGGTSSIGNYYSTGGGPGAGSDTGFGTLGVGSIGGSGGGGSSNHPTAGAGGSGTPGLGNAGGTAVSSASNIGGGGGGGGSGSVGANAPSATTGGAGGAATASTLTNTSLNYAAGGGGGGSTTGGAGVASVSGAGGGNGAGSAGTVNTGGGGGGGGSAGGTQYVGGAGGSGLVIVRVAV